MITDKGLEIIQDRIEELPCKKCGAMLRIIKDKNTHIICPLCRTMNYFEYVLMRG